MYKLDNDEQLHFISQGKTILVSHVDEEGKRRKAKGYWGLPYFSAISDIHIVPEWLRRTEQGTSIFSAGFRIQTGWQYRMAASLLANFFAAIHKGDMEFEINKGEIKLNRQTVGEHFEKDEIRKGAEENNSLEGFEFAKSLFACITSAYTKEKIFQHPALGKISFKILVGDHLPKRLALIRNGMVITDSLEYFGDKFARFPMAKEFIAIVEAQENAGNALIKTLENPRHDGLSAERINDPDKRKHANTAIKDLIRMIRQAIKEETTTVPDKEVTVDELTEFFADDTSREKSSDPEHEDNLETFVYDVDEKQRGRHTPSSSTVRKSAKPGGGKKLTQGPDGGTGRGGGGGPLSGNNDGTGGDNPQPGQGDMDRGSEEMFELDITDIRNMVVSEVGRTYRRIFFTSPLNCTAQIAIQATGINNTDDLRLSSARSASISNNMAVIDVLRGQRVSFEVEIAEDYRGPIEIIAYTTGGEDEN
jgi:hypothetical protein